MANRIIFLVRHGQYTATTPEHEEPDGRLTDFGKEQAALTAKRLQSYPISIIHHSTLERATETAVIIARNFPGVTLKPSPLLRECIPSIPQGFEEHFSHIPAAAITQGKANAHQAYASYISHPPDSDGDQYELIISHGNLISFFITHTLKAPLDSWLLTDVQHGGICEIISSNQGRLRVIRQNDVGHLPIHLQTFR
jgi:serine/threonine-protein phosphatase PGAM5